MTPTDLLSQIDGMFAASEAKLASIDATCPDGAPSPVFTVNGRYTSRGWTEWTRGFQFGSQILQFDATGNEAPLALARGRVVDSMAQHLTHTGVHDHGFNIISTFGNLLRLAREGKVEATDGDLDAWRLALRVSGAVQANRWTEAEEDLGFIYSFNGPHSLFADTMRSLRSLAVAHKLGQHLGGEGDVQIDLLKRLVGHACSTARWVVYMGSGRDIYDVRGRVAHESLFDVKNGAYRCPATQQGYSPFTTWTRGLAWVMLGFAEEIEFLQTLTDEELSHLGGREALEGMFAVAARATADLYISETPTCGVPYWDTGAPGLQQMEGWREREADPFNVHEPVDSSAAAIACQGLLRLGEILGRDTEDGSRYYQAGLSILSTLLNEPYLCLDESHQGLLLHSVYHVPNGWDHIPKGQSVPCGEASMWGDYHLREAALLVRRQALEEPYLTFF